MKTLNNEQALKDGPCKDAITDTIGKWHDKLLRSRILFGDAGYVVKDGEARIVDARKIRIKRSGWVIVSENFMDKEDRAICGPFDSKQEALAYAKYVPGRFITTCKVSWREEV